MAQDEPSRRKALEDIQRVYDRRKRRREEDDAQDPRRHDRTDQLKRSAYRRLLARHGLLPLGQRNVLDVGCQWGIWLADCRQTWGHDGGQLCGIDLMAEWIEQGKRLYGDLDLHHGSGDRLPFEDHTFDLVHQGMVFSSVLDADLREGIAAEIRRVLRPGGHLLWYDFFFNPTNSDTISMTRRHVQHYFPDWEIMACDRVTLAPPLSRALRYLWPRAIDFLTKLRILNFHYLMLIKKVTK